MKRAATRGLAGLLLIGGLAGFARAGEARAMPAQVPAAYTTECSGCHIAYPPGLLPAASWQRTLSGLHSHYGTNAELDPQTLRQLATWLAANAAPGRRVAQEPPEDRITRTDWFQREHRDIAPSAWKLPAIGSASNCAACHLGAARGRFHERELRLPAGVAPRRGTPWRND